MRRPRKRPDTELSKFLDIALARQGLTNRAFGKLVGIKPATLSDLKLRKEAAAPDRITARRWAEVLKLNKADEHTLFELLQLAHSPGYVQEMVAQLRVRKSLGRAADPPKEYRPG